MLAGAPDRGHGRVQDESVQSLTVEEPVQVGGAHQLRRGTRLELGEIRAGQRAGLADAGGVYDGPDRRAVGLHLLDQPGQGVVVADIAGCDRHARTQSFQSCDEFARAGCVEAAP